MRSALEIVKDELIKMGADGLCNLQGLCGCGVDDLAPCSGPINDCVAAQKTKHKPGDECECELVGDCYSPMSGEVQK